MSLVINMTNNCERELAVLNDSVVFCFRVEKPRARILGTYPLLPPEFLTGLKISASHLMETRTEAGLLQEHSTSKCVPATSCKILQGEELIAQKKNNHQWLD